MILKKTTAAGFCTLNVSNAIISDKIDLRKKMPSGNFETDMVSHCHVGNFEKFTNKKVLTKSNDLQNKNSPTKHKMKISNAAFALAASSVFLTMPLAVEGRTTHLTLDDFMFPSVSHAAKSMRAKRDGSMRRPFADLVSDMLTVPVYWDSLLQQTGQQLTDVRRPRFQLNENDEGYRLTMEVPGVAAQDLDVTLESSGRVLRVKGSRKYRGAKDEVLQEAKFEQAFELSPNLDIDGLKVSLADGILDISAPKLQPSVRKLEITKKTISAEQEEEGNEDLSSVAEVEVADGLTITTDEF